MSGYEVIPVTSNPFSSDTDKDYYPDNLDDNKLEDNPMYIFDGGIKDYNFHDGNPIEEKTSDKYTDGELIVDNTDKTAKYSFVRRPRDNNYTFSLKPDGRSFYKFNLPIDISYEKGWWLFSETVYVEPESDGTYLLEQGTEYTIEIKSNRSSEYVFTVEQDNWEFAPNGCIQTVKEYSPSYNPNPVTSRYFLSEGMLHAVIADIVGTKQDLSDIDNINKIMDDLGYDRDQYIVTKDDVGSVIFADVLLILSVYSLGGGLATEGMAAVTASRFTAAGAVTGVGSVIYDVVYSPNINLIKKFMGYLEKLDIEDTFKKCQNTTGEYNIYCSNCVGIGLNNMWEVWASAPYVRKIDGGGTVFHTERIDPTYTARLRNDFGWK